MIKDGESKLSVELGKTRYDVYCFVKEQFVKCSVCKLGIARFLFVTDWNRIVIRGKNGELKQEMASSKRAFGKRVVDVLNRQLKIQTYQCNKCKRVPND